MKRKLGKISFVLVCIMILIMPYTTTVLAAALSHTDTSSNLETLKLHEGGEESSGTLEEPYASYYDENMYGYKVGTTNILKLIVSGDTNYENAFYCLNAEKSFPGTVSLLYRNVADLKDDTDVNVKALGLSAANYKSLIWLVNNVYLEKQAPEQKDEFLSKAFADEILGGNTLELIKSYLTDDDIDVVQQWAIWYFTNGDSSNSSTYNSKYESFSNITLTDIYGNSGSYLDITGSNIRQEYAEKLYTYLIAAAKTANGSEVTYPSIEEGTLTAEVDGEYYKVGPFKVTSGTASSESYSLSLTDGNNEISRSSYNILLEGETEFTNSNIDEIFDTNYYIYLPIENNDINKLKLSLTYSSYETEASLWTTTDTVYQPVTLITREVTPHEETIEVEIEEKTADLALRKYIIKANGETVNRAPTVDVSGLIDGTSNDAEYRHAKNPIEIECGDTLIYEIRVYNEGDINAKATQIVDYLPEGLEFVEDSEINEVYGWVLAADGKTVTTTYLNDTTLEPFNKETGKLDSSYVQIECKISDDLDSGLVLTNIAEIKADNIDDRDSTPGSNNINNIDTENYSGNKNNKTDLSDSNYYYKGTEDDDDFEKVVIKGKVFDLALKKFVTKVNNVAPTISREPKVDVTNLKSGSSTDAEYTTVKTPLTVKQGDIILYTMRVYNEGDISGYAEEVTDYLPEGLGFLVNYTTNIDNYWAIPSDAKSVKLSSITNGTKNLSLDDFTDVTSLDNVEVIAGTPTITSTGIVYSGKVKLTSTKLKSSSTDTKNLIEAFDKENGTTLDYKDVQVACIVLADTVTDNNFRNIAEIEKHSDENRDTTIVDRDSVPGTVDPDNYPGNDKNQDDNDYEDLTTEDPKEFDLSLQKFITALNDTDITNRIPTITKNSDGTLRFNHTTDALSVANNDLITYTIRVYNEGDIDGYAKEVSDNIPNGLVYVTDNETNKKYGWAMYDSNGKVTTDASKAVTVKTDYLSKKASETRGDDCLIKAYDSSKSISTDSSSLNPDYRDVKIIFKISESVLSKDVSNESNRTLINIAEITDDEDADGNKVEDRDSTPGNGKEEEDDLDKEKVYVKYFDLALKKDVIKAIITQDGKTSEISTTDPDLLKVEIHRKKLSSTVVKFVFNITVTNEGEIAGYATEVKDYVPDGLEFIAADNPDWTQVSDKVITTNALAKKLLQPGESASVQVIMKWTNSESNMGLKTNTAEISADYNENGSTDIDSTPDNKVMTEDDIDTASVILSISTGSAPVYVVLSTTVLAILATGIVLIKKYVLF